ncbi:MAG: ABC transporter ATP-binding protein, partial [Clostridioides sp.]|nr:ABC transporter ATP-binding protein [Clostridioides sp.]
MKKESNLKRFFNLIIKKNKMKLVFSFMLVAIVGAIDLFLPQITKKIVDEGISRGNISLLIQLIIIYFVISSMSSIFDLILEYIYSIMKNRVSVTLKLKLLDHISKLSGRYYSNIKTGNLMSIVESDVSMIENFDASLVFSIVNNAFTAIISAFLLIKMRFDLFVIVLVLQIILTFIQNKFTKAISGKMKVMREQYGENSNLLQEYISNLMNVVFSKSKLKFFDSYIKKERSLIKKYINIDITMVGNVSVARIFSSLITVATYGYGGYLIVNKKMTLGSLIAFQQYTNMLIGPCISIIRSNNRIQQAKVSIDRVYSVIDEEIEIKTDNKAIKIGENIYNNKKQKQDKPKQDKQNQDKEKQDNKKEYSYEENNKKFKKTVETIEFKNVFFSYDKSNQCVSKEKKCISNEKKHINNIEKISENKKIINQESINENKISKDKDLENENYILNDVSLRFEKG